MLFLISADSLPNGLGQVKLWVTSHQLWFQYQNLRILATLRVYPSLLVECIIIKLFVLLCISSYIFFRLHIVN